MDRLLISLSEMASRLNRTPRQFRKDISDRKIPHVHIGRQRMFDPEKVIEHLTVPKIRVKAERRTVTENVGRFAERLGL